MFINMIRYSEQSHPTAEMSTSTSVTTGIIRYMLPHGSSEILHLKIRLLPADMSICHVKGSITGFSAKNRNVHLRMEG